MKGISTEPFVTDRSGSSALSPDSGLELALSVPPQVTTMALRKPADAERPFHAKEHTIVSDIPLRQGVRPS